jgi:hypothetical protein
VKPTVAKLSEEQAKQLEELESLRDAPDEDEPKGNGSGRMLNISIDLGDDAQVQRAFDLGLLTKPELEQLEADGEGGGEGGDGEGEEGPKRRGFFPEK